MDPPARLLSKRPPFQPFTLSPIQMKIDALTLEQKPSKRVCLDGEQLTPRLEDMDHDMLGKVLIPMLGGMVGQRLSMTSTTWHQLYCLAGAPFPLRKKYRLYPAQEDASKKLALLMAEPRKPQHPVLFSGRTGSGKTRTVLYTLLTLLLRQDSKESDPQSLTYDKILWCAPPSISAATIVDEFKKAFDPSTHEWITALCAGGLSTRVALKNDYSKVRIIVASAQIFRGNPERKNSKGEEFPRQIYRKLIAGLNYRYVVIDEAHIVDMGLVQSLRDMVRHQGIVLVTGTPPLGKIIGPRFPKYYDLVETEFRELTKTAHFEHVCIDLEGIPSSREINCAFHYTPLSDSQIVRHLLRDSSCYIKGFPPHIKLIITEEIKRFQLEPLPCIAAEDTRHADGTLPLIAGAGKGKVLLQLLEELGKVVIFVIHPVVIKPLLAFLAVEIKARVFEASSQKNTAYRAKTIAAFDAAPSIVGHPAVLISTPAVAGVGLNYHSNVSTIIFLEPLHAKIQLQQCIGRMDRIGQSENIMVHVIYSDTWIEEETHQRTTPCEISPTTIQISAELRATMSRTIHTPEAAMKSLSPKYLELIKEFINVSARQIMHYQGARILAALAINCSSWKEELSCSFLQCLTWARELQTSSPFIPSRYLHEFFQTLLGGPQKNSVFSLYAKLVRLGYTFGQFREAAFDARLGRIITLADFEEWVYEMIPQHQRPEKDIYSNVRAIPQQDEVTLFSNQHEMSPKVDHKDQQYSTTEAYFPLYEEQAETIGINPLELRSICFDDWMDCT